MRLASSHPELNSYEVASKFVLSSFEVCTKYLRSLYEVCSNVFSEVCFEVETFFLLTVPLSLMCSYIHTTHYLLRCVQMCVCCPIFASVLCIAQLCTHCATVLLCRIPRRCWLKASAGGYDTSLLPSSLMEQAKGSREMGGEVVFGKDTKSNLLKAVSGTEWMYRRRALKRGGQVSVNAVCCVSVSAYT